MFVIIVSVVIAVSATAFMFVVISVASFTIVNDMPMLIVVLSVVVISTVGSVLIFVNSVAIDL